MKKLMVTKYYSLSKKEDLYSVFFQEWDGKQTVSLEKVVDCPSKVLVFNFILNHSIDDEIPIQFFQLEDI